MFSQVCVLSQVLSGEGWGLPPTPREYMFYTLCYSCPVQRGGGGSTPPLPGRTGIHPGQATTRTVRLLRSRRGTFLLEPVSSTTVRRPMIFWNHKWNTLSPVFMFISSVQKVCYSRIHTVKHTLGCVTATALLVPYIIKLFRPQSVLLGVRLQPQEMYEVSTSMFTIYFEIYFWWPREQIHTLTDQKIITNITCATATRIFQSDRKIKQFLRIITT